MEHLQKSFARGILSPNSLTRVNIPGYDEAARELFNIHIGRQGEAYKRGGLAIMARLQQAPVRLIPFKTSEGPFLIAFTGDRITSEISSEIENSESIFVFSVKDWQIKEQGLDFSPADFFSAKTVRVYGSGTERNIDIWAPYWQNVRSGLTKEELLSMDYAQLGNVIVFCGESFPPFVIRKEGDEFVYYRNFMDMLVNGDQSENKQKSLEKAIKTLPFNFYGYGIKIYRSDFYEDRNYEGFVGNLTLKENYDQEGLSKRNLQHWTNRAFVVSTFEESEAQEENAGIKIFGGIIKKIKITSRSDPTQYEISGFVKSLDGSSDVKNQWTEAKNPNLHLCDWSEKLGWPVSVSVFENRFVFGGNSAYPSKIWYSAQPSVQKVQKGTKEIISYATAEDGEETDRVQSRTVQPITQALYFEQTDFFSIDLSATGLLPLQPATPGNLFINDNLGFKILWIRGGEVLFVGTDIGIFTSRGTIVDSSNPVPFNSGFQRPVEIPVKRVLPIIIDEALHFISQDNSLQVLDPRGERRGFTTQTLDNFSRETVRDVWIRSRISKFLPTQNINANPSYNPQLSVNTAELIKNKDIPVKPWTKIAGSKTEGIVFTEAEGESEPVNIPAVGAEFADAPAVSREYDGSRVKTSAFNRPSFGLEAGGTFSGDYRFRADEEDLLDATSRGTLDDSQVELDADFYIDPDNGTLKNVQFEWANRETEFNEIWDRNEVYMLASSSEAEFNKGNFIAWRLLPEAGLNNEIKNAVPFARFGTYKVNLNVSGLVFFRSTFTRPISDSSGTVTSGFLKYQVAGNNVNFNDLVKAGATPLFQQYAKMVGDKTNGLIASEDASELKLYRYAVAGNNITITELRKVGNIPKLRDFVIAGNNAGGVIFGGEAADTVQDKFYKYAVAGNNITLTELEKEGDPVSGLKEAGIGGSGTQGVIFGGRDNSGNRKNDFYKYVVAGNKVMITELTADGVIPELYGIGMYGSDARGVIFGGRTGVTQFNYYLYVVNEDEVKVSQMTNTNNAMARYGMNFIIDVSGGIMFAGHPSAVSKRFDGFNFIAEATAGSPLVLENEEIEENIYPVFNSNTRLLFDWSRRILFLIREGAPYLAYAKNKETGVMGWSRGDMKIQDAVFMNGLPFRPPEIFSTLFGIRGNNIVMLSQGLHSYKENFINSLPNGIDDFVVIKKTSESIDLGILKISLRRMGFNDDDLVWIGTDKGLIKGGKCKVSELNEVINGIDGKGFIVGKPFGFHLKTWPPLKQGRMFAKQENITQIVYNAIKNSEFLLNNNYVYDKENPHSNAEINGNEFIKQVSQSKMDYDPMLEIKGDGPFPFAISGFVLSIP